MPTLIRRYFYDAELRHDAESRMRLSIDELGRERAQQLFDALDWVQQQHSLRTFGEGYFF